MTDIVERLRMIFGEAIGNEAADYIEMLRGRVIAFESLETKRMKDAVTADDWRRIAEHMEYNWRCCSDGFNKTCGELRQQLAECQAELKQANESLTVAYLSGFHDGKK